MSSEAALALGRADPGDADAVFRAAAMAVRGGLAAEALPLLEAGSARHGGDARIWQVLDWLAPADVWPRVSRGQAAALAPRVLRHSLARATLEAGLPAVERSRARVDRPTTARACSARRALLARRIDEENRPARCAGRGSAGLARGTGDAGAAALDARRARRLCRRL